MKTIIIEPTARQQMTPIIYNRVIKQLSNQSQSEKSGEIEIKLNNILTRIKYLVKSNSIILF